MTSPFARHGIDHLSASSCNMFASCKALWVMEKLLKRSAPVGAAVHRGSAVEAGVTLGLREPNRTIEECVAEAERVYRLKTALCGDPRRDAEGAEVPKITRTALAELAAYGPGVVCQERIEWHPDDLPVPFVGYADFYWPHNGVLTDLKTQLKLTSEINVSHARQVALYAARLGNNVDSRVTYVTPKKAASYGLENPQEHLNCLITIAKTMERYLSISNDPWELAGIEIPDVDSFWFKSPQARQNAWEVYRV